MINISYAPSKLPYLALELNNWRLILSFDLTLKFPLLRILNLLGCSIQQWITLKRTKQTIFEEAEVLQVLLGKPWMQFQDLKHTIYITTVLIYRIRNAPGFFNINTRYMLLSILRKDILHTFLKVMLNIHTWYKCRILLKKVW